MLSAARRSPRWKMKFGNSLSSFTPTASSHRPSNEAGIKKIDTRSILPAIQARTLGMNMTGDLGPLSALAGHGGF
jgi:hypothetical protein